MMAVVGRPNPPLRLMLGADAFGLWKRKRAAMDAVVAGWREVGEATAFEGAAMAPVGG